MSEEEQEVQLLRGGRAAQERAAKDKAEREKRRAAAFSTWEYFQLAAAKSGEVYGESKVVRVVTDEPDWLEVRQHSFIPTKDAPRDLPQGRKWPERHGAVCRYTYIPRDGRLETWFDDCYICDRVELDGKKGKYKAKPSPRLWAWAVEREAYRTEDGELAYRDMMVDRVDADGNTSSAQKWVVLNFASENFFDKLIGFSNVYDNTVVDRDYKITRKGSGTDTDYEIIALDPQFVEVDGKMVKLDLRKDQFKALYEPPTSLFSIIKRQVSDEHYEWYFDNRVESSWEERFGKKDDDKSDESTPKSSSSNKTTSEESSAAVEEEKQHKETLNAMRERLKASKAKAAV